MPLDTTQQKEIKQATLAYLQELTLIHAWDQHPRGGQDIRLTHQQHCFMYTFSSTERDGPHGLFAPREAWEAYLAKVGEIGEGRINFRTISRAIDALCKQIETLPIPTDKLSDFAQQVVDWSSNVFDHTVTAYVPLVNIELTHEVESLPLARTTLHRGRKNSPFAEYVQRINEAPPLSFDVPLESPYLVVEVVGDDESIEEQVAAETDDALRVLRFVCWTRTKMKGTQRISLNSARDVARYPFTTTAGHFLYVNADNHPFNRYLLDNSDVSRLQVDQAQAEQFNLFGLEHLNTHFAHPRGEISEHILLALEWYDNGLHATTSRDAVYRFLVCLNAIVGWNYGQDNLDSPAMAARLKKLFGEFANHEIRTGEEIISFDLFGEFEGLKDLSSWNAAGKPPDRVINKVLGTYAELFTDLYQNQRNAILHGKPHKLGVPIHAGDVKNAQLLAQNGLRLVLKLIDQNPNWSSQDDVEDWFS